MSRMNAFIRRPRALGLVLYGLACACSAMAETSPDPTTSTTSTTVIRNDGEGSNRIVVTGNSARNVSVDCGKSGQKKAAVDVNSVSIDGKSLKGETIIVAGRNTRTVHADTRCDQKPAKRGSSVNVNSVNIR